MICGLSLLPLPVYFLLPPCLIFILEETLDGDNDLPSCIQLDKASWEADFLKELGQ